VDRFHIYPAELEDSLVFASCRLKNAPIDCMVAWQNDWIPGSSLILRNLVVLNDDNGRLILWLLLRKGRPLILERLDNLVAT
jgi:hypothetical protein